MTQPLLLLTIVGSLVALRGAAATPETPVPKVVGFAPIGDVQMYSGRCQCQLGLLTSGSVVQSGYDAAAGLNR